MLSIMLDGIRGCLGSDTRALNNGGGLARVAVAPRPLAIFLASCEPLLSTPKLHHKHTSEINKGKGSPYAITERRVPELILVLGSQPAGDVSHKPSGRMPLLSARPAVTPATLTRAATNFAA